MHELGHNLGLHHGGDDEVPNKPNYLSVMNYSFQLTGLMRADASFFLDYSRFGISLDEAALDEAGGFGIGGGPAAALNTLGKCPSGAMTAWLVAAGPTDFDCDGATNGTVAADINGDGGQTVLRPFVDWPALVFVGGGIGGSGVILPSTSSLIEPPLDELLADKAFLETLAAAVSKPGDPAGPGEPPPAPATPAQPAAPLALTALSVSPARFRAARRGASIGARRGAGVAYTLSAAARVRFTVERLVAGRRRGGRCRPAGSVPRGKRCTRRRPVPGSFSDLGSSGPNSFRFTGRIAGRTLSPGRYRLVATPVAADGERGSARAAAFKVRRAG
jgi:hypothetical protein